MLCIIVIRNKFTVYVRKVSNQEYDQLGIRQNDCEFSVINPHNVKTNVPIIRLLNSPIITK